MPAAPVELGLELGFSSSAATGDALVQPEFNVDFGDKIAARNASSGGSGIGGIIGDATKAVVVAIVAKFLWSKIK